MTKKWYASKTLWINLLFIIFLIVQSYTGYVVEPELEGAILVILNVILRLVTKEEISW